MKRLLLIITLSIMPVISYGMNVPVQPQLGLSVQDLIDRTQLPVEYEQYLDLSSMGLTSLNGLQNIPNKDQITFLDLSDNQIIDIPEDIFASFPHLTYLDLSGNLLVTIHPRYFAALVNLEGLFLDNNNILELRPNTFNFLPKLKRLSLAGNRLKSLPKYILFFLTALNELDISENNIAFLDPNLLRNQKELSTLSINKNKLQQLPHITHLTKLKSLNLKGNKNIKELSPQVIAYIQEHNIVIDDITLIGDIRPYSIGQLIADLGENWKQELVINDPMNPTSLVVNLSGRGLTDLSDFPPALFEIEDGSIRKISAKNNYIREIPTNFIVEALKIRYLGEIDFSNNRIELLPSIFPEKFVSANADGLTLVDLANNKIKILKPNLLYGMNIQALILGHNKIHTIAENSFNGHNNLKILGLWKNKLTILPRNVFTPLVNLHHLILEENKLGSKEQYVFPANAKVDFYPQRIPKLKLIAAKKVAEELEGKSLPEVIGIMQKIPVDLHGALFKAASNNVVMKMHSALKAISLQQERIKTEKSLLKKLERETKAIHEKQ